MDIDTSSEMLRSFGEYSSLDSSLEERFLFQRADEIYDHPYKSAINKLLQFQATYNISNAATIRLAQIQNEMEASEIEIPLSINRMEKNADHKFNFEYYVFCSKCKEVVRCDEKCSICDIKTVRTRDNFFIYVPVKQQIALSLHKHLDIILRFLERERAEDLVSDIYDGKTYQEVKSKHPNCRILSLTFNLDGASVSNSSKMSIWPILLYQNYLPPGIRFMKKNVLLAGVICSLSKPDLSKFILPFCIEMNQLTNNKITLVRDGEIYNFCPLAMFCLCDLPARAEMQQIKYVSGYFSCPICLQKGTSVSGKGKSSYVRFVKTVEKPDMRTHKQFIDDTLQYLNTQKSVNGLKGITPLFALPHFSVVDNVSTDHMHGVFLGIVSNMIDIWFGKKVLKNIKPGFKMSHFEDRVKFNTRILQLKPYSRITRKPRSLFDRSFFKAIEYRNLLWFYIHYALYGILDQSAINHFDLLSAATYILNKPEISKEEINEAGRMLEKFADEFEIFYGSDSITMNIHMLRHYSHNVLNGGPLWSQNMFAFESRMGDFKKCQRSKVCIAESIVKKYCLNEPKSGKPKANKGIIMLRAKLIDVHPSIGDIFKKYGLLPAHNSHQYNVAHEICIKNEVFKSISSRNTKSCDHFIKIKDGTIGMAELFIANRENVYVLLKTYEILHKKYHLYEVKLKQPIKRHIYNCNEICEKLIYLQYGNIEVVTSEPNMYVVV